MTQGIDTFSGFPRREATSLEALMAASFLFGIAMFALISRTGILKMAGRMQVLVMGDGWRRDWRRGAISELIRWIRTN